MVRIACFDIGKKNFAFYAEECDDILLQKLKQEYNSISKIKQKLIKEKILQEMFNVGYRIDYVTTTPVGSGSVPAFGVFDIRDDKDSNDLDMQTRVNMQILLKKYEWLWNTCDVIVIEQQYFNITSMGNRGKGSGANVDAIKLAECCVCWFLDNYYPFKEICYFGSMYKTQLLGAPPKLTKPQRKKWSIEKGVEIFKNRGDEEAIDYLAGLKNSKGKKQKQDDVFDCLIMCQAYKFKKYIASE
jgi:hypothetical protein